MVRVSRSHLRRMDCPDSRAGQPTEHEVLISWVCRSCGSRWSGDLTESNRPGRPCDCGLQFLELDHVALLD